MPGAGKKCACGSGKPYGACCGARKVTSLEQVRWRRAGHELRRKLGEFADQPSFAWDAARSQELYLGSLNQQLIDQQDDFTMERCFEWFIFDYKMSSGHTVIETYRDEQAYALDRRERALLNDWCYSRISLYEVFSVVSGEGLKLKDLLGHGEYYVHDLNAASEIESGSILLIRVLKVGEEHEFSTSGLALPADSKSPLLNYIIRDMEEYNKEKKPEKRTLTNYLKERAHKINARVMEMGAGNGSHDFSGREGRDLQAIFIVKHWKKVFGLLEKSPSFLLLGDSPDQPGFRQVAAAWLGEPRRQVDFGEKTYKKGRDMDDNGGLRPVLAHILLMPKLMVVSALSPRYLAEAKRMIQGLLGGQVTERKGASQAQQARLAEVVLDAVLEAASRKALEGAVSSKGRRSSGRAGTYSWPDPGCAEVAGRVREDMQARGYSQKQQKGALKLWFDFCSKERPNVRKSAVWAATVVYAYARLEKETEVRQQDLAGEYGVASSSISTKFRRLCQSLELLAYDQRYSTKKPPGGKKRKVPLLSQF